MKMSTSFEHVSPVYWILLYCILLSKMSSINNFTFGMRFFLERRGFGLLYDVIIAVVIKTCHLHLDPHLPSFFNTSVTTHKRHSTLVDKILAALQAVRIFLPAGVYRFCREIQRELSSKVLIPHPVILMLDEDPTKTTENTDYSLKLKCITFARRFDKQGMRPFLYSDIYSLRSMMGFQSDRMSKDLRFHVFLFQFWASS